MNKIWWLVLIVAIAIIVLLTIQWFLQTYHPEWIPPVTNITKIPIERKWSVAG